MESQQIAPHHHHEPHANVQLHQSVEGELEEGQHHEKKSVLKKVKAKAKKIKDTITKHGHAHDHDYEDDDQDDSEDEGEVIVEDPQLQGAPLYEGAAMRSAVGGRRQLQQDVGVGMPTTMHNEPASTARETTSRPAAVETGYSSIDKPTAEVVNSAVEPNTTMSMSPWSLGEDPHSPKNRTYPLNSEVKTSDPAGRVYEGAAMRSAVGGQRQLQQDVGVGMPSTMHNEPAPTARETTSRPAAVETGYSSIDKPAAEVENSAVEPNTTMSMSPWSLVEDPHLPKNRTYPLNSEVKTSDPAGRGNKRGSEEAGESQMFDTFAKMKVTEKIKPNQTDISLEPHEAENRSSYAQKLSAVGSAMGGTAVAAKDFMASKLGYGETTEHNTNTNTNTKSSSALEFGKKMAITVTEKLKPGEEDRALSNVISEAFNRRKEEMVKVGETAFRLPQPQQQARVGKVTESEELTRRLGREDEGKERSGTAAAAVRSVADTVKDTVGSSWLGNVGDRPTPSQQSLGSTQGVEGLKDSSAEAEVRILQESAN